MVVACKIRDRRRMCGEIRQFAAGFDNRDGRAIAPSASAFLRWSKSEL